MQRLRIVVILLMFGAWGYAQESGESRVESQESRELTSEGMNELTNERTKKVSKGLLFFYRTGNWVDNYLRRGIDTSYVDLPEHSWRLALTTSTIGVNSTVTNNITTTAGNLEVKLLNRTTPSMNLGFNAGFRGFGFGYSWDLLDAYAQQLNFSFGTKYIGLDFSIQTSTNISTSLALGDSIWKNITRNNVVITNANLNIWYAMNAKHYSHQAAVKQSYIQKKSAGSLLLHLSYMSSQIGLSDTLKISNDARNPLLPSLMSGMRSMTTRQVAVGLGYGINYTPNKGKFLLHASAAAMLVTYSINTISYYLPDSVLVDLPSGEPMYKLQSAYPVHFTGNVRLALSWEINEWIHMSAWAVGDHIRFRSKETVNGNTLALSNWDWKVQVTMGVRLGAGRDRVQRALLTSERVNELRNERVNETPKKSRLPQWLTDYFWSPKD